MSLAVPEFDVHDVALLISAVEQALQRLHDANERKGGSDAELIEYGRRYSLLLEKLNLLRGKGQTADRG